MRSSGGIFDIATKLTRISELEKQTGAPGFWDDAERARGVMRELGDLKGWVEPWEAADRKASDLVELGELIDTEGDDGMEEEFRAEVEQLKSREHALQQTLVAAQKMAEDMKDKARTESDLLVREARLRAEQITREAQGQLARLESDIGRSRLERDALERGLRGVLEQHIALLDLRQEAHGEMDNLRVLPTRVGTEVG